MLQPSPAEQDFFWDDLLEYIEERRVVPIVGAELLTVPNGTGSEVPLQSARAQKLAERLRVPADDCTGDDALHQVVCRYLQRGGRREEVYPRLRNLLKELAPAAPESLRQLASSATWSEGGGHEARLRLSQLCEPGRNGGEATARRAPTPRRDTKAISGWNGRSPRSDRN